MTLFASRPGPWGWTQPSAPVWPPFPGLLEVPYPPNRADWKIEDWQRYAEFLERMGESLLRSEIERSDALSTELFIVRSKLRRGSKRAATSEIVGIFGLLTERTAPKRGRKPGGENQRIAAECLKVRTMLEAEHPQKRVTDRIAVQEWLTRSGLRASRVNQMAGVLSEMSRQRRKLQK